METIFIQQFEEKFNLSFGEVTNFLEMGKGDEMGKAKCIRVFDNGMKHYIDKRSMDVYSFDTFDRIWLEKNIHKDEVLSGIFLTNESMMEHFTKVIDDFNSYSKKEKKCEK